MPGCVLRVLGNDFDPRPVLTEMELQPYSVFLRGDRVSPDSLKLTRQHETGGFMCDVAESGRPLYEQAIEAQHFLESHEIDLRKLLDIKLIERKFLDFGYDCRIGLNDCYLQCDYLPAELLKLCGNLGIGIELSLYPAGQLTSTRKKSAKRRRKNTE